MCSSIVVDHKPGHRFRMNRRKKGKAKKGIMKSLCNLPVIVMRVFFNTKTGFIINNIRELIGYHIFISINQPAVLDTFLQI